MGHTILLVDDDPNVLRALKRVLHKEPYEILTANAAEQAAQLLQDHNVDLIVSDEEMPGMSGTEFLAGVAREYPDTVRIVLTGHPTVPNTLRAINEGKVYQFFTKPCNEIDLAITIRRALEQKDLLAKSHELLELTRQQSALIEEAKMLRRMRPAASETDADTDGTSQQHSAGDQRALIDQIDEEVTKGRRLLCEAATRESR
jgi:two-component system probable response regulator PhcQ